MLCNLGKIVLHISKRIKFKLIITVDFYYFY